MSCPIGRAFGSPSRSAGPGPAASASTPTSFPYDPIHQTFVNIYEDTALKLQLILDASHRDAEYYSGSTQGRWAVVKTFVMSGIEHILIGPDHILFLIGLLLLGGTLSRLALIVTSFTIGHSITLSLAALDILSPSGAFHRAADRADDRRGRRGQLARPAFEKEEFCAFCGPGIDFCAVLRPISARGWRSSSA